ncbi:MAG: PAS domain S-box protein [Planctomycetia bacterium]|nr:PAS domain S-box protein [Planctomycetia bacterium]
MSVAAVVTAVAVRLMLEPALGDRLPFITLFAAIVFIAWYGGRGPALLALVVGSVAVAFFVLQPRYSFAIGRFEYQVGLVLYGVVGFACIAMFESLRKAQRRAEERGERLRTTLASIGDGVISTDTEGRITDMNAVAESLTGWTLGEAKGQALDTVFRIVNEETRQPVQSPVTKALKQGVIVGLANHTVLIAKDGTERPIDDSAAPIRCKGGEIVGCVLVFRDVTERRRQETALRSQAEQLRDERERLRVTLASIGDAVITTDTEGRITFLNAVAESLTGWPQGEAAGKPLDAVFNIVNEETRKGVDNPAKRALREGVVVGLANHTDLIRKDGTERPIDDSAAPIRDGDGRVIGCVLIFRDITERRRAEQQVANEKARIESVMNNVIDGVITIDESGRAESFNRAAEELFGYTAAEVIAQNVNILMPEPFHGEHDGYLSNYLRTGEAKIIGIGREVEGRRKDGSTFPMDLAVSEFWLNQRRYFTGIVRDITERKLAEATLRRQAALLHAVNDNTSELIFMKDRAGRLTYANAATLRVIGMTAEQALGSLDRENFQVPAEHDAISANDRSVAEKGRSLTTEETYTSADGRRRVFLSTKSPLRDDGGQIVGVVGVSLDITDRKQMEREREERAAELALALGKRTEEARRAENAERLLRETDRRKDEFLATLAHELRNPLAPLLNALELLRLANDDKEAVEESRSLMERQVQQLIRLVDDLLDVSRITKGKLQLHKNRVELAGVLKVAIETVRPLIEASLHELTVTLPPQPIHVLADPTRLAQVFVNLLNNAAKYTDKAGHIWLTVQRKGPEVAVSVRDTGIGIPSEHLPHIFRMFSQVESALDRSQGGLGIGLSLVKGLVELHGGTIEARSGGPRMGSEFTVQLPIVDAVDVAPRETIAEEEHVGSDRTCRILVVDDLRDSADSMAKVLRTKGHDIRTAYDGLEAVQTGAAFQPHVVLLDIGLPKMNGYDVARRIRNEPWGGNVALVAMTGWGQEEDKRRSLDAGFDHHLTKPVDAAALERLLAVIVSQH